MKNLLRIESFTNKYNADHFNINLDYFGDYNTKINYNNQLFFVRNVIQVLAITIQISY